MSCVKRLLPLLYILLVFSISCKKNNTDVQTLPEPKDSSQLVNRWMLDSMLKYYLWIDELSVYPSLEQNHLSFFNSLLSSKDRFSQLVSGSNSNTDPNSFNRFGFNYLLVNIPDYSTSEYILVVTLVVPGSPSYMNGLVRGNYFSRVNGQKITESNKSQIISSLSNSSTLKLTELENKNAEWKEKAIISITPFIFENRPVLYKKIFTKGNIHTGYVLYNGFNEQFDKDILDVFDTLKSKSISELIIDMRYNQGGSIATASKISAVLLKSIKASDVFAIFKGNKRNGTISQSFERAISTSNNIYKRNFQILRAGSLNLNRVFLLTGETSASATEVLINNLKPYIQVVHIGEKTFGKNIATTLIRHSTFTGQQSLTIIPEVFSIYNSNNLGDYIEGIIPHKSIKEFSQLPLLETHSVDDPLTSAALFDIYGTNKVNGSTFSTINKTSIYRINEGFRILYNSKESVSVQAPEWNIQIP